MKSFILLSLVLCSFSLKAAPQLELPLVQDELSIMDRLIERTQKNIEEQKAIRDKIGDYKQFRSAFMLNNEDKQMACELIASAQEILSRIDQAHLTSYFGDEFLEELEFFSKIAHKKTRVTAP